MPTFSFSPFFNFLFSFVSPFLFFALFFSLLIFSTFFVFFCFVLFYPLIFLPSFNFLSNVPLKTQYSYSHVELLIGLWPFKKRSFVFSTNIFQMFKIV